MKLSMKWLQDFCDCSDIPVREYCDRMTDTGSKVEGYELLGADIENVVVGQVLQLERHPDSDHLWICQVALGEETPRQIVTGAQNLFIGAKVPVAKAVAKLPGGVVIKPGKLRGALSNGMFCSIAELGLTTHDMPEAVEDGILILPQDAQIGADIRKALQLEDTVVDFEITSNRPDCLSVIGLARESAASFDRPLHIPTPIVHGCGDAEPIDTALHVVIDAPEKCMRYSARLVRNVKIEPSPLWMRMRLRAAGVRPINNIVDITNYVMLEYGQPMHAFDRRSLQGDTIHVRMAQQDEPFVSLDGAVHTLERSMLVIADAQKACALAGVMGGENSEITEQTTSVVFESACFDGPGVRIAAKTLGMRTESSARFEKGLDPENTLPALERACELVELLHAGEVAPGIIDVYPGKKAPIVLPLECERMNRFLGVEVAQEEMVRILKTLHFQVKDNAVTVPSFRGDIACMNDLAEEIIRIYGYNRIASSRIHAELTEGGLTAEQKFREMLHGVLCACGYHEISTFTFISPKDYDKICLSVEDPRRKSVVIRNPLGEDTSVMRTTAIPSMLEVLSRNDHFHSEAVALYEMGKVFLPRPDGTVTNTRGLSGTLPDERLQLTIASYDCGDFFHMKGIVQTILSACGIHDAAFTAITDDPIFHPGRCAAVCVRGRQIGRFGELHPAVAQNYELDRRAYVGVLDESELFTLRSAEKEYHPLPKYPAVSRDLAFVCDEEVTVGTVEQTIRAAGGKLLTEVRLFDVYRGAQLGEGKKSVAFSLAFRAPDRTLTDDEVDKATAKIRTRLSNELGLSLRG